MERLKKRGRQCRPTKNELVSAWSRIRNAAEAGDLHASALLISLVDLHPLPALSALAADNASPVKPTVSETD